MLAVSGVRSNPLAPQLTLRVDTLNAVRCDVDNGIAVECTDAQIPPSLQHAIAHELLTGWHRARAGTGIGG